MINEKIKKQVFDLSGKERAELAHELIDSHQPEKKHQTEEAWSKELKRRIDRYEEGESSTKPWREIKEDVARFLTE